MRNKRFMVVLILVPLVLIASVSLYYYYHQNKQTASVKVKEPTELNQVVVGTNYLISNVYPNIAEETNSVTYNSYIFEPLVSFDKNNKLLPVLASKWDNPDSLTWRFYIAPNAHFSDGTPLTANDVKFSWDYIQSNNLKVMGLLPSVSQVVVVDNKTVEFVTKTPNPLLANGLAQNFMIFSEKDIEKNGAKSRLGSGQYTIVKMDSTEDVLARNENYWGEKPKVKNITFKFIPEEKDRVVALLTGEINFTAVSDDANIIQVNQEAAKGTIQKKTMSHSGGIDYLALDGLRDKSPYIDQPVNPLKDIRVRQAMYEAIDINQVIKDADPIAVPATQLVFPGIFGYNPAIQRLTYNLDDATELMKQAGYEKGFNLTIDCETASRHVNTVQSIARQLAKINITVKVDAMSDSDAFYNKEDTRDTSAYEDGYASDTKDAGEILDSLVHTPTDAMGIYNLGYSNSTVDKLIEQADVNLNQQTRLQQMQQALKISADEVAVIPLYAPYDLYAYSNNIVWQPRLDGSVFVSEMTGPLQ
jgi:peptide/nickel transport system substrate-binding protein